MPSVYKINCFYERDLDFFDLNFIQKNKIFYKTIDALNIFLSETDEECHIILEKNNILISIIEYNLYEVEDEKVPGIYMAVTIKEERRKGYGFLLYETLLEKYGKMMSDVTLNGNCKSGSKGLWFKLISKYPCKIYDKFENKVSEYSNYKAFQSKVKSHRKILISFSR